MGRWLRHQRPRPRHLREPASSHRCPSCGAHYGTAISATQCERSHDQPTLDDPNDLWGYHDETSAIDDRGEF